MKKLMLIMSLLSVLAIANAQVDENKISDTDFVQKNELKMPPEIIEIVLTPIKNYPHVYLSEYDNKYWSQLEDLQLGRLFPEYMIDNDTLKLSGWLLPFLFNGEPLFLARGTRTNRGDYTFLSLVERDKAERILNYEYKDSIVGILEQRFPQMMSYLIIRKENKDIFVQVYDKATDEYFKNEYSFSEINNLIKDITQKMMQRATGNISLESLPKNQLEMTPEINEMLISKVYSSFIDGSDKHLSNFGIKNKEQLKNLHFGKPIPEYGIDINNENLIFTDRWQMLVMSNDEPLFITRVKLEDDGQYSYAGNGSAARAEIIHNYEHKDLIIGCIRVFPRAYRYLIIRKDNKNIIVGMPNSATREYFKEYSLSEVIKQIKE
jgi:hypothetical protein